MARFLNGRVRYLIVLASVLVLAAAACDGGTGPEDQNGENGENGPPADLQTFCQVMVDAKATVVAEGPQADVGPLLTQVEETAPQEIQEDVATVVTGIRAAGTDPSALQNPEFAEADEAVDQYVVANCGYETVEVSGVDHAFEGLPETLPAGRVGFNFTNDGEEVHEMVVFRINDDVEEPFLEILELEQEEAQQMITFVGAGFGPPGSTDGLVIELEPGRYGVSCFVPVGTTDPETGGDGPPHFTEGMIAEFTVG